MQHRFVFLVAHSAEDCLLRVAGVLQKAIGLIAVAGQNDLIKGCYRAIGTNDFDTVLKPSNRTDSCIQMDAILESTGKGFDKAL